MVKGDEAATANVLGKKARIHLSLRCYDDAIADALASRDGTRNDWKAYLVAAKACYQLQRYEESLQHLDSALEKSPSEAVLQKERDRCQARVRESKEGGFDFCALSAAVNRRNIHLDAASFVCKTEVRDSAIHGRGLFATCDIGVGELIFCEKAMCLPNEYNVKHNGAALYVKLVEACSTNPSLHREILQLHSGSYKPSNDIDNGRPRDMVDGAPVVDVFLLEAIRRANCFMGPHNSSTAVSPAWSLERDGMARGMWPRAARANHACWPNSSRSFLGDLLLSVATEPICAGDEITHVYLPPRALPESRARQFVASWGFACGCRLCAAEATSPPSQHVRRRDVLGEIAAVIRKQEEKENARKRGSNTNTNNKNTLAPSHSVLRTLEKLTRKLEELHEEEVYGTLPRLALVWPTMWLLAAYRGMGNHAKTLKWAAQVLRNFGLRPPAGTGEQQDWSVFDWRRQPVGITTFEAARALRHARDANLALGRAEAAGQCDGAARLAWRILVGFEPEEQVQTSDWIGDEYKGA